MSKCILYHVQHLVGVGHVFRAMRIVRALVESGHEVEVVYGGEPIPNFDSAGARVHYLQSLRAGSVTFNDLEDIDGNTVDEAYKARRRNMLLSIFEAGHHDAIITEAFPFGRRQMRFELVPLLEAAKDRADRPVVISSVRDILQENRKPGRNRETVDTLRRYYDHVLVHGDPKFVELDLTFPLFAEIEDMARYTGMVAPERLTPDGITADEEFDVVVSVGGGMLGRDLLFGAVAAKTLSCMADARWCVASGIRISAEDRALLERTVSDDIELRRFLPDLCTTLSSTKLSISRCGYNTTADFLTAGCRSVVVPLSDGTETEQLRRGEILHAKQLAVRVDPARQTPELLASAIDTAMSMTRPIENIPNMDGAKRTASFVTEILASRR